MRRLSEGNLSHAPVVSHVVPAAQVRLGSAIEKGSFGVVRRARWLRANVAVKVLPTIKPTQMQAFLKEMSFACALRHPNIVATMGAITEPYCALIMELMPWGSLKASLNDPRRRQYFNLLKMLRGMMSVCRAGAYLSSVNVIHRDISSKNVFVNANFESMKLGDFGYSSQLDHHIRDRQDPQYGRRLSDELHVFAGAPAYKAPELLCSKPIYSEASDVFAFSIVSWEMLTTIWSGTYGRPWSDIESPEKLQIVILEGKRPPIEPSLYRVTTEVIKQTEQIVEIVKRCWDANAKRRPNFLNTHDVIANIASLLHVSPDKTETDEH